ncbi:MAG: M48 family metallopeptidase [Candidatus Micrarchaeia archaeon]
MEVEISGKTYPVVHLTSANKNAWARLKGGSIVISVPSRWPSGEKARIAGRLLKRAVRAISDGRWSEKERRRVAFAHGQVVNALGSVIRISLVRGKRFGSRLRGDLLEVRTDENHPAKDERVNSIVRKRIVQLAMPRLQKRVEEINDRHFGSRLGKLSVRDTISRWGSCSADGSIRLSFRLLFMPEGIVDYVIAHELAHTRYRSHGKRFWALVGKADPCYKQKRRWLKMNGSSWPQDDSELPFEEPY